MLGQLQATVAKKDFRRKLAKLPLKLLVPVPETLVCA